MCEVATIVERETQNSGLVYIYREGESWYAYGRSAYFLCQMLEGLVTYGKLVRNVVWLTCVEVKMKLLPLDRIVSFCDDEYVLSYVPYKGS